MKLNYPAVHTDQKQKVFISFIINQKRYRLYNGKRIGSETNPNSFPLSQRENIGNLLAAEIYNYLINGGQLSAYRTNKIISGKISDKVYLTKALDNKLKGEYSDKYKSMLRYVYDGFVSYLTDENIASNNVKSYLNHYALGVSYSTIKRHLNVLINEARNIGMNSNHMENHKSQESKG